MPGQIEQVGADGATDQQKCYEALNSRQDSSAIHLCTGGRFGNTPAAKRKRHARDENLWRIQEIGRREWKRTRDYHWLPADSMRSGPNNGLKCLALVSSLILQLWLFPESAMLRPWPLIKVVGIVVEVVHCLKL